MEGIYISIKTGREVRHTWAEWRDEEFDMQVIATFGAPCKDFGESWLSIEDGSEEGEIFILQ
jgi:hypothetical protein